MGRGTGWLAPLTGLAFLVLSVITFAVAGEPPDPTEESAREIVEFYVDEKDAQTASAVIAAIAATLRARSSSRLESRSTRRSPLRSWRPRTTSIRARFRR